MFGSKYTIITAITMTLAALAWGFNLYIAMNESESFPTKNLIVFVLFAGLAAFYWVSYARGKSAQTSEEG